MFCLWETSATACSEADRMKRRDFLKALATAPLVGLVAAKEIKYKPNPLSRGLVGCWFFNERPIDTLCPHSWMQVSQLTKNKVFPNLVFIEPFGKRSFDMSKVHTITQ